MLLPPLLAATHLAPPPAHSPPLPAQPPVLKMVKKTQNYGVRARNHIAFHHLPLFPALLQPPPAGRSPRRLRAHWPILRVRTAWIRQPRRGAVVLGLHPACGCGSVSCSLTPPARAGAVGRLLPRQDCRRAGQDLQVQEQRRAQRSDAERARLKPSAAGVLQAMRMREIEVCADFKLTEKTNAQGKVCWRENKWREGRGGAPGRGAS